MEADLESLPTDHDIKAISAEPIGTGQRVLLVTCHALACEVLYPFFREAWRETLVPHTARHFVNVLHGASCGRIQGVFLGIAKDGTRAHDLIASLKQVTVRVERADAVRFGTVENTPFLTAAPLASAGGSLLIKRGRKPRPASDIEELWQGFIHWPTHDLGRHPDERWNRDKGCQFALTRLSDRDQLLVLAYAEARFKMEMLRCITSGPTPTLAQALVDRGAKAALWEQYDHERRRIALDDRAPLAIPIADDQRTEVAIDRLVQTFRTLLAHLMRRASENLARRLDRH